MVLSFIKKTAEATGKIISLIWPRILAEHLHDFLTYVYTGYVQRRFKHFGSDSVVAMGSSLRGLQYVTVGNNCSFFSGFRLSALRCDTTPEIIIGNGCEFGNDNHITCINSIQIGNHLLTGSNVIITDNAHGRTDKTEMQKPPKERDLYSKGKVKIGNNVWIANNVCILPGVTIGDGVIIAANSVVTKSIPDYCVAAGTPAKIVRQMN